MYPICLYVYAEIEFINNIRVDFCGLSKRVYIARISIMRICINYVFDIMCAHIIHLVDLL